MATLVGADENYEGKLEDLGVKNDDSSLPSRKQIGNPVVYKLVRVEGDGRLVPATDDEIMEVKDLLEDGKSVMHIVTETGQTVGCNPNEVSSSGMPHLENSEGLSQAENTEASAEKLNARLEEILPSLARSSAGSHSTQPSCVGECFNHADEPREGGPSTSGVYASSKPDFSKVQGEICLDNLSIKELHETFKATFGRETTVKDKQWLKRRIAMGLTNSCDVSTTSFIIKDNKLVNKGKEESCNNVNGAVAEDQAEGTSSDNSKASVNGSSDKMEDCQNVLEKRLENYGIDFEHGSGDVHLEERAAKRVRKPTRRYIEELSEAEPKDHCGKLTASGKFSGVGLLTPKSHVRPVRNVLSDGRTVVTRVESLGGSGIQVPCVCRIRRSRPRKNIMALMKFHPSYMGMKSTFIKKGFDVHAPQSNSETSDSVVKVKSTSAQIQQPFVAEPDKNRQISVVGTVEGRNVGYRHVDSSGDTSDDNVATVPTSKGGLRRKHHRAWTLSEVMKLVEGVSRYGAGRWSEIKKLAFASYSYRTSVDLKDKWRNLLKASFAQAPSDKGANSRKHASVPIPAPILLRVRQLAEMQAQVPPNVSSSKLVEVGVGGRSVVESSRSGYL